MDPILGTLCPPEATRDAVHVAIAPVIAGIHINPGQHVGLTVNGLADPKRPPIGVADPFLSGPIIKGERFYLFLYPGTIQSLRHEWTHPGFDGEQGTTYESPREKVRNVTEKEAAEAWIARFAEDIDMTVNKLMTAADDYVENDEYTHMGEDESYKGRDDWDEFWSRYKIVRGKTDIKTGGWAPFSCAC